MITPACEELFAVERIEMYRYSCTLELHSMRAKVAAAASKKYAGVVWYVFPYLASVVEWWLEAGSIGKTSSGTRFGESSKYLTLEDDIIEKIMPCNRF